jgi:hypothetical protein
MWMMPVQGQQSAGVLGISTLAQGMSGVLGASINMNDPQMPPFHGAPLLSMLETSTGGDVPGAEGDASWYFMQADGRWQPYDAATSTAIDAAFRVVDGGSIDVEIEGRRFSGTAPHLRQFVDNSVEERSSSLSVRRFTQDEAYRRAAAAFFGNIPMSQGWPGMGQSPSVPARKPLDNLVCVSGQGGFPKTAEEWRAALDRIAARLSTRPFLSRSFVAGKMV